MHSILLVFRVSDSTETFLTVSYCSQISMHLSTSYSLCRRSSCSPTMRSILLVGASVSESHLGSSTRRLSVYIIISYVRHFWSRGPRATRKRKPAHLKFRGHMHACCIYVANASRAIFTLIERLHMYSSSLITSSAG